MPPPHMLESNSSDREVGHQMNQRMWGAALVMAAMTLTSGGAQALSVGAPTNRANLGETLRMSIPLELAEGDADDDGCPQATVMYGDQRVDAGQVILGVAPQTGRRRVVTVRAIRPIDEPLIEVRFSYGCDAPLSRTFTVFASPPAFVPTVVLTPAQSSAWSAPARSHDSSAGGAGSASSGRELRPPAHVKRAAGSPPPAPTPAAKPMPEATAPPVEPLAPGPAQAVSASAMSEAPEAAPRPKPASVVLRPPSPQPAPRLVLDPVMPMMLGLPGAGDSDAADGSMPTFASSRSGSDLDRLQAQLAQDRQRLDEMEKLVLRLRDEAGRAGATSGDATGPASWTDTDHPAWLIAVSVLAAVLLAVSASLYWRVRRYERARAWWAEPLSP